MKRERRRPTRPEWRRITGRRPVVRKVRGKEAKQARQEEMPVRKFYEKVRRKKEVENMSEEIPASFEDVVKEVDMLDALMDLADDPGFCDPGF